MILNATSCTSFSSPITWYINKDGNFVMKIINNDYNDEPLSSFGKILWDDGIEREISLDIINALRHAYAMTIHKSQGSEFPVVVMPLAMQQFLLLQRNLIYTGVTRGKRMVVLIGQKKALETAVRNRKSVQRYSALVQRLRSL